MTCQPWRSPPRMLRARPQWFGLAVHALLVFDQLRLEYVYVDDRPVDDEWLAVRRDSRLGLLGRALGRRQRRSARQRDQQRAGKAKPGSPAEPPRRRRDPAGDY